jgi:hypothetical protein
MCIVPKFSLIDAYCWFHLFSNYLFLVALFNLKVSYAFMFCFPWRTSWKQFVCFSLWFEHTFDFHCFIFMIFCLCSFSCYNMVAKSLLSRLYLSYPCFKFLWSQLTNAYIYDQDCVGACHLKNYFFCYHLPTRAWAGVKLGDAWYVSNVSIIFDAPCLFSHHLPNVSLHFMALLCIFRN